MDKTMVVNVITDWWAVGATIVAGCISALVTWIAVLHTEKRTAERFENELKIRREEQDAKRKSDMLVIVEPTVKACTFADFLDFLMMQNKWNRTLLLSGKDGFDFFDDFEKRCKAIYKILTISNDSNNDIKSISISTNSILTDSSESKTEYSAENFIERLRKKEDIVIRILNEEQHNKIRELVEKKISNELVFKCDIKYISHLKINKFIINIIFV